MTVVPAEKTILVVDDEVDLCEILQFDLEEAGYRTIASHQAHHALEVIARQTVDLVISDIRMPGGDGAYLLDQVRHCHHAQPPVIFVSGFADISSEEAYHRGVSAIFTKPLASEKLLDYVGFLLTPPRKRWKKHRDWNEFPLIQLHQTRLKEPSAPSAIKLGRGGMMIMDSANQLTLPRPNDLISVRCFVEDQQSSIEGLAVCRWQRPRSLDAHRIRGIGVKFLELTDESIMLIQKFTNKHMLIPYIPMK